MKYIVVVCCIILISLIALRPSFNIALTGDDYLGLWRYHTTIADYKSNLRYFFTDYGPQDFGTLIIHNFVDFQPQYYYYISYILRLVAAFSFFPLIYLLTKRKFIGFFCVLFFATTVTGIETTDWSFNMPSYIGIAFMNLALYFFFTKQVIFYYLFSILAIIIQPIRLSVLPIILVTFSFVFILIKSETSKIKLFLTSLLILFTFLVINNFAQYGGPAGLKGQDVFSKLTANFQTQLSTYGPNIFLNPIGQLGNTLIPTLYIPSWMELLTHKKMLVLGIGSFVLFSIAFLTMHKILARRLSLLSLLIFILGVCWTLLIWYLLLSKTPQAKPTSDIISIFWGGYVLIIGLRLFIFEWKNHLFKKLIILSLLIIFTSYVAPWLRDPNQMQPTHSRYLIVSAAGITLLISSLLVLARKHRIIIPPIALLLVINIILTNKYFSHLEVVRNAHLTLNIRRSIPAYKSTGPEVYYFESDQPEILYHSIMFGFPVIMYYENNLENIWNIVYTTDWNEVVSAYKDGNSLKRFGASPIAPVALNNIHSFKINFGKVEDTTEETISRLKDLD